VSYPFKFNSALLKDNSFGELVREVWNTQQESTGGGAQSRLVGKLKTLKARVRKWLVSKKKSEQQIYIQLEKDIVTLMKESLDHPLETDSLNRLNTLEKDRNKMLLAEEELWRQKSRANWILSGDKNTKFSISMPALGETKNTFGRLRMNQIKCILGRRLLRQKL
jgi:hypothetical protein